MNPLRRFRALCAAGALALFPVLVLPGAANAGRLYVSDETGGDVAVIDLATGSLVTRIAVGKRPRGIALSHDGLSLYVALSGSAQGGPGVDESKLPPPDRRADGIGVIDLRVGRLLRTLESGPDPETFALSPDGRTLFVSNEDSGALSAVDIASGRVRAVGKVGIEPEGVAVRPDGKVVYAACEGDSAVYALDAVTLRQLGRIPTKPRPRAIAFARDGGTGYISDEIGSAITVFDTATHQVRSTIPLAGSNLLRPMGLAVTADGRRLYVTTGRAGSLLELDLAMLTVKRTIAAVGERPWGLALSADDRQAYTANGPSGDVTIVDLAAGVVARRIHVGGSPWGVVYSR